MRFLGIALRYAPLRRRLKRDPAALEYTDLAIASISDDESVELVMAELERLGIPITEGPIEYSGTRMIFIRDPDGSVVELNQSTGEAPA